MFGAVHAIPDQALLVPLGTPSPPGSPHHRHEPEDATGRGTRQRDTPWMGSAPKHLGGNEAAKLGALRAVPPTSQTTKSSVPGLAAAAAAASLSAGAPFGAVFPPGSFLGEAKQTSRAHVLRRNARLTLADKSRKQARFSSHSVSQLLPTLRSQRKYFDGEQRAGGGLSSQASTSGPPELPRVSRAEHGISPSFCRACSFLEQRFLQARMLHARAQLERILRNLEGLKSPFHVY